MAARPVIEEAPASSIVYCSQYRREDYERQNGPLPRHERVGGWLRDVQAAYSSGGSSPYPTLPSAPRKDEYVSDSEYGRDRPPTPPVIAATYSHHERGAVSAQGLRGPASTLLLCHGIYVTGLKLSINEGSPHDFHPCFTNGDIVWQHSVKYDNDRERNQA